MANKKKKLYGNINLSNPKMKIKKGDKVIVLAGKDKGKEGEVTKTIPTKGRVIVSGINLATKHQKPIYQVREGGAVKKELSINISNIAVKDPKTGKATKIGYKFLEDGKKVRIAKKSGEQLDK